MNVEMVGVKDERIFHDAWAFFLYILCSATNITFTFFNAKEFSVEIDRRAMDLIVVDSILLLGFMVFVFLALRFFPKGFLFFTTAIAPVLMSAFVFITGGSFLVWIVIAALSTCVYFFFIRPFIPLTAAEVKVVAKILLPNAFGFFVVLLLSSSLLAIQEYAFLNFLKNDHTYDGIAWFLFVVNAYWTILNIFNFVQVFSSGMIIGGVIEPEKSSLFRAIYNSIMALGSISLAGMISAIIHTLRLFVQKRADNARRQRDAGGWLSWIFMCFSAFLLGILQDILETMNALAFPYLALHGTGYKDSIVKSFGVLTEKGAFPLLSGFAAEKMTSLCTVLFFAILVVGNLVYLYSGSSGDIIDLPRMLDFLNSASIIAIPPILFAIFFLWVFFSGCIALSYLYVHSPESLRKTEPELAEEMEALIRKESSSCRATEH